MELRRGGFEPVVRRVETREDMQAALGESWDLVLSDYHLPRFSAPEALEIYHAARLDVPFIIVSGAVGEETAAALMQLGAHDYLLKHRLTRLPAAVERELAQAEERRAKRRAENLFRAVLRSAPQPSVIIDRATRRIVDGSESFHREFSGDGDFLDVVGFSQPERIEQLLARGSGVAWHTVDYRDGVAHVANVRCHSVDHEGASYAFLVLEDVTEQHYLKAAFDAVGDPLLIISSEQRLLYANRAAEELFGSLYFQMEIEPLIGATTQEQTQYRVEYAGHPYNATSVPFRFAGEPRTSTILTLHDVSEEAELQRLATHDALTGVYNTRFFDTALSDAIARDEDGTVAIIDLDYFKPINDELGHAAGDAALILFANMIRAEIRSIDVFARLGGDEFAILFPRTTTDGAQRVLEAIYARLARTPFRFDGTSRPFSASAGIANVRGGETAAAIKRRADEALYEAKRAGRGRYVLAP